jgi:type I restriction enzyme, S subunit
LLPVPYTSIENQDMIVARIIELLEHCKIVNKNIEEANEKILQIDQAIIDKAFRGKLVPQNRSDESGSSLLKNISGK